VKIAIVSNTTWNIVNFRLSLIKVLVEKGHKVLVISPRDRYVDVLEADGIQHIDIYMDNKGNSPLRDLRTLASFFSCYSRNRFDLVLHYTIKPVIYGGLVSRVLGVPYISTITGLGTVFIRESLITRLVHSLYRISQKRAHRVFFQNRDDMALFLHHGMVGSHLAAIVPGSGINTDYFCCSSASINEDGFVFLLVARMLRDKGVYEFVEAARAVRAKYSRIRFQLLGPVDVENNTAIPQKTIDKWCAEGVVEYHPTVDDVRPFLQSATCVVLPSYREGLPRTLLEAAAMGKPLIATDTPGCRDVVLDGVNGYLCRVADVTDLAEKMELIINLSLSERQEMGKRGREKVKRNFEEKIVIEKYLDVIDSILNDTPKHS